MLTYAQALAYLYSLTDYETKTAYLYSPDRFDLGRVEQLLAPLGSPHRRFRAVHIAGTKGKGSTAAIVESILRHAGYRTGLYTSPHLHTFRERIQAGGALIPEADVARWVQRLQHIAHGIEGLTTFELMTALAFGWFAEQRVDWAVVEVGMGGRLDATNVLLPQVSVITSISLDHTVILGSTVAQIAAEKAGIIKPGVPVVCAPQAPEALAVIRETCQQQGSPLTQVGRDWTWEEGGCTLEGQSFSVQATLPRSVENLWLPLLGPHQLVNTTTALAALGTLNPQVRISDQALRDGLQQVTWPGRMQILGQEPLVMTDSAHNPDSAQKLRTAVEQCLTFRRLFLVVGMSAEKDWTGVLQTLVPIAHQAYAVRSLHPRAAAAEALAQAARALGLPLEPVGSVGNGLAKALTQAAPEDLVLLTGSVFVAANAEAAWRARKGLPALPFDPVG
jgi:dihydrofolate synthase/folylpolyglutamate synthase